MTKRKTELLLWLQQWFRTNHHGPSYGQIAEALGLKSKTGITKWMHELANEGFIARAPYRARSVELTDKGRTFGAVVVTAAAAPLTSALAALFEGGIVEEDETTGLATVRMDALGAVELSWRGDA